MMASKTTIQGTTIILVLFSGSGLFWAFTSPVSVPDPPIRRTTKPVVRDNTDQQQARGSLKEQWGSVLGRRFQGPLYDPVPKPSAPVILKETPPPPIQILATIVEPGGGIATIRDDKGRIRVLSVGATISAGGTEAKLIHVAKDSVDVEHEGKVITMSLKTN